MNYLSSEQANDLLSMLDRAKKYLEFQSEHPELKPFMAKFDAYERISDAD